MKLLFLPFCISLLLISSFLYGEEKKSVPLNKAERKNFGISTEAGFTHYRRGYGFFTHIALPLRIVKNLYFEPSLRFIAHKNSNSSFFSVVNYNYDNRLEGLALALNTNFKYRFQIIPLFGILLEWGAGYGIEFNNTYNYYEGHNNLYLDFFIAPEAAVGTFFRVKNFRIDFLVRKFFPVVVVFYQTRDNSTYLVRDYRSSGIYVPLFPVCLSAFSVTAGVTCFLK